MLNRIDDLLKAEEVDKAQLAQLKMSFNREARNRETAGWGDPRTH